MKFSREEKVSILMAEDIIDILSGVKNGDYEFVCRVLRGDGYVPYEQLRDLDEEFENRYDNVKDRPEIMGLANIVNGEPIQGEKNEKSR